MKICEIKYPQMFKSYIDCISKTSRLAKLSTCKNDRNFQFAKLSPREIKVFYSIAKVKISMSGRYIQATIFLKKPAGNSMH